MFTIVTIGLAVLKSMGVISWEWWIVLAPAALEWLSAIIGIIIFFVIFKKKM